MTPRFWIYNRTVIWRICLFGGTQKPFGVSDVFGRTQTITGILYRVCDAWWGDVVAFLGLGTCCICYTLIY